MRKPSASSEEEYGELESEHKPFINVLMERSVELGLREPSRSTIMREASITRLLMPRERPSTKRSFPSKESKSELSESSKDSDKVKLRRLLLESLTDKALSEEESSRILPVKSLNSTIDKEVQLEQLKVLSEEELSCSERRLESSEDNLLPRMVRLPSIEEEELTEELSRPSEDTHW